MTMYFIMIMLMTFLFALAFIPAAGGIGGIIFFILMLIMPDFFIEFTGATAVEISAWYLFVLITSILLQVMLVVSRVWLYASPVTWIRLFNIVAFIILAIIIIIMNFGVIFGGVLAMTLLPSLAVTLTLEHKKKCVCAGIGSRKLCYNKDVCETEIK